MKKVIDGKMYNTETAEKLAEYSYSYPTNMQFFEETLYRSRRGQFFIVGSGGAMSKYSKAEDMNTRGPGSGFELLSPDEAREWLENYSDAETIERYFDVEEG